MTKEEIETLAASLMPSVLIETVWTHDNDGTSEFDSLAGPGDCFENEDPDDWQCWQSEVRATAIIGGRRFEGSDYLGGTWEKYGDNPEESNPDISGYYPQMLEGALFCLTSEIPQGSPVLQEIGEFLGTLAHRRNRSAA